MLLYNPTDDTLRHTAPSREPYVNGDESADYPPRMHEFAPGAKMEVADSAGEVLLEHLGPRGLVSFRFGDDMEALRRQGRRQWFEWLNAQVVRHKRLNEDQKAKGLATIAPNADVLRCFRVWKQMKAQEFHDEILDDPDVLALSAADKAELGMSDDAQRARERTADLGDAIAAP